MSPVVTFWLEFASTYTYPAVMRAEAEAAKRGVALIWRPLLLGPIFKNQGMNTSPFNLFPGRGRYMIRDMERICGALEIAFKLPDPFPQNSLLAARCATALAVEDRPAFVREAFTMAFGEGAQISEPDVMREALKRVVQDADAVIARAQSDEVKGALRAATEEAEKAGVFGAPTFVCADGEVFWGNDRLEAALDWAKDHAPKERLGAI
ncbi:MAG: 2-hydroxychromene-2-carboxylate isomerase [Hyphomonadaceae bacterium]|nr:2-hydroxychromene-2-carboxylate isomerase [Hyphomonadaceae bacterium]